MITLTRIWGVKFSTYAVPMIIGEIRRYLRDNNSIRVSRSLRDTAYKAIHAKEILTRTASTEPTLEDIAKETSTNYVLNDGGYGQPHTYRKQK